MILPKRAEVKRPKTLDEAIMQLRLAAKLTGIPGDQVKKAEERLRERFK